MSELYMIITCILQSRYRSKDRISLRWKKRLVVVNVVFILLAGYFFIRHNSHCEPYGKNKDTISFIYRIFFICFAVYSLFALSEYIVVLTNMAFHMTASLDFKDKDLVVYKYGVALCER